MFWFIIAALSAIASLQTYRLVRRGRMLKSANAALSEANKTLFALNQQLQAAPFCLHPHCQIKDA